MESSVPTQKHGGLGVINLELHNEALLLKQLHTFYSKENTPWVKLIRAIYGNSVPHGQSTHGWWRDILSLVDEYRSISCCPIGGGTTTLLWKDFWVQGDLMCDRFPRLYSYTLNEDSSVAELASSENIFSFFALPLSVPAYEELQEVPQILMDTQLDALSIDRRIFTWGNSSY
jgi:hypothetical protein